MHSFYLGISTILHTFHDTFESRHVHIGPEVFGLYLTAKPQCQTTLSRRIGIDGCVTQSELPLACRISLDASLHSVVLLFFLFLFCDAPPFLYFSMYYRSESTVIDLQSFVALPYGSSTLCDAIAIAGDLQKVEDERICKIEISTSLKHLEEGIFQTIDFVLFRQGRSRTNFVS